MGNSNDGGGGGGGNARRDGCFFYVCAHLTLDLTPFSCHIFRCPPPPLLFLSHKLSACPPVPCAQWWAQYLESTEELDEARKYYAAADDALSLVRVYCFCEEIDKARELVRASKSKAAAYHLAK